GRRGGRLVVGVAEGWLGLVFAMVLAFGAGPLAAGPASGGPASGGPAGAAGTGRRPGGWLPRAAAATAVLALLGTAAIGPDRLIAERNVDRYLATGHIDLVYLSTLSPDALPALMRLPDNLPLSAPGPIPP